MFEYEDTICAPATSVGTGAISIIRVSGKDALAVCDKIVKFRSGSASSSAGYAVKFGEVPDVDEVLVTVFRAPHSYTGEDGVEISCHASTYIVTKILALLVDAGARMAQAGEFTRRAFAAGKMDLAQAEAVADVIASGSEASHRIAMNQLKGAYSLELKGLRDKLVELTALLELELDFSEEDVEFADRSQLRELLDGALAHIESLAASFHTGNALKNGVPVAIVGAVNSGKSTLLNALVGDDRAIVSDIPGTTRDTIEEHMTLGGVGFRFIDTAGLRETEDYVEKIGVSRSFSALSKADVVIVVLDACRPEEELVGAVGDISGRMSAGQTMIVVRNKVDLMGTVRSGVEGASGAGALFLHSIMEDCRHNGDTVSTDAAAALCGDAGRCIKADSVLSGDAGHCIKAAAVLDISAKTGEGLDALKAALVKSQEGRFAAGSGTLVTSLRHYEALKRAADSLEHVRRGMSAGSPTDLVAEDLRSAISELNSIFGEVDTIDFKAVTDVIFSRFCIGK